MKQAALVLGCAVRGGLVGYYGFAWLLRQGFYGLVLPGGLRLGQVVGQTDARAERAKGRPYTPQNVLATIYHVQVR